MTTHNPAIVAVERAAPHAEAVWALLVACGLCDGEFEGQRPQDARSTSSASATADSLLIDAFVPPSLVFNRAGSITRLVNLAPCEATIDSPGAAVPLWADTLRSAVANQNPRRLPPLTYVVDGTPASVSARVIPSHSGETVVAFERSVEGPLGLEATRDALRQQTLFLEAIVENIPNMIFVKEADELRFVRFNRAGESLLGFQREDLLGRNDYDLFPPDEADFFTKKDRSVLESGRMLEIAEEPIHTAGGTRYLHTKKVPLLDPVTGAPQYLLGISEDITERRLAEDAIRAARNAAEEASRAKSQFLANMSHELRTPLTAILGYAEMLQEDATAPTTIQDLDQILWAGRHLLELISGILDLSKVEAGRMDLRPETFDVRTFVDAIEQTMRPQTSSKGNTFVVQSEGDVPTVIHCDRLRLRQCLLNLVSNATKFTQDGEVRIVVRADGEHLEFSICDTGIGMSEEQVNRVFEPFYQADMSRTRRYGGTGLGLSITRRIAELMSGTLTVESRLGKGTKFTLSVPIGPVTG